MSRVIVVGVAFGLLPFSGCERVEGCEYTGTCNPIPSGAAGEGGAANGGEAGSQAAGEGGTAIAGAAGEGGSPALE